MGLNYQRAFDIAALRIIEQGQPSHDTSGLCRYRVFQPDRELRCAIGWLIPDYRYQAWFEDHAGGDLDQVARRGIAPELGFDPSRDDVTFLNALRFAHDASSNALRYGDCRTFLAEYIRRMHAVAKRYDLDPCCLERRRVEPSSSHHGQYVFAGMFDDDQ